MNATSTDCGKVVLIFGPTGTAGSGAVQASLQHPDVAEVRAVTRRSLGISHTKLREVRCTDFEDLSPITQAFEGVDVCLFCLGTSARNVNGGDQYRQIHVTYALAAALALLGSSASATFVYLSGAGAKRTSWMMWARIKAEAEDKLAMTALSRLASVRPAGILPIVPTGANRWLLAPLLRIVPSLGIDAIDLGQAMLRIGLNRNRQGRRILENRDLKVLLKAPVSSG